jgi:phosphopantothenoylcysteine decarboxylase/phosphopantothenate--cysteine ligase
LKGKKLEIVNLCNAKFAFAFPLLNEIVGLFSEIHFINFEKAKSIVSDYAQLLNVKISFSTLEKENKKWFSEAPKFVRARLILIDDVSNIPHSIANSIIVYPLLHLKQRKHYEKLTAALPQRLTPLTKNEWMHYYCCGRVETAQLLLRKELTDKDLTAKSILISSGPTIEDIDPIRYLSNRSTGKMGQQLAIAAWLRGAEVQLVTGPTNVKIPKMIQTFYVRSAAQMFTEIKTHFPEKDMFISAAAVADFTPAKLIKTKLKKTQSDFILNLKRTTDILLSLKEERKEQIMVGFSLEMENELENSKHKIIRKNLDYIIINNPANKGAGFEADTNIVSILNKTGQVQQLPLLSKFDVSNEIYNYFIKNKAL